MVSTFQWVQNSSNQQSRWTSELCRSWLGRLLRFLSTWGLQGWHCGSTAWKPVSIISGLFCSLLTLSIAKDTLVPWSCALGSLVQQRSMFPWRLIVRLAGTVPCCEISKSRKWKSLSYFPCKLRWYLSKDRDKNWAVCPNLHLCAYADFRKGGLWLFSPSIAHLASLEELS